MKLLAVALIVLIATTLRAQPTLDLYDNSRFRDAYFDTSTNEVTFKPFQEINWASKARNALPWLNLDRPSRVQIARLSQFEPAGPGYRSADFRAPLDTAANGATYLLLYSAGVVPVRPIQLKGTVGYQFDASLTTVKERSFTGYVVGKPLQTVTSAAFVIVGRAEDIKDVDPRANFERRRNSRTAVYDFIDSRRTVTWTNPAIDCTNPKTGSCSDAAPVISFRLHDEHYLLVKWKDAVCESAYTLFLVAETLKPVAGNIYGCDP